MEKQDMRNAAYTPEYLKQRGELESLLFQETNFVAEKETVVSPYITLIKREYALRQSKGYPYNLDGSSIRL